MRFPAAPFALSLLTCAALGGCVQPARRYFSADNYVHAAVRGSTAQK